MTDTAFRSGFIALVGRPNVGKSTLLNQVLGEKIAITSPKPQTTRNRILGIHNMPSGQILFLDTPGIHRAHGKLNKFMVDQAVTTCSDVDLVLLLAEAGKSPDADGDVLQMLKSLSTPVVLGINKIDLVRKPDLLPMIASWKDRFPFREIIPFSAATGQGVPELVQVLLQHLPEGPRLYPEDMITDQPERFIAAEMIREKVLLKTREEIPYGVAVTIDTFTEKPEKDLVVLQAVIHVERETHKRIVVGKGGSMIRSIGKAAREDIQRMLGCRVFLELFVRVDRNWTESSRLLREFGYE